MSVEAKEKLLGDFKARLSDQLTVSEMDRILNAFREEMIHYEIRRIDLNFNGSDDRLQMYIDALRIEGRSLKTLRRYEYVISRFLKSVNMPTTEISVFDIRNYLSAEKKRGISDATLEGIRQIFSGYFGWLHRESIITKNPMKNIGAIKSVKKVKDTFSDVDMELMKKQCKTKRDIALITFLFSTGCRIGEVVALNRNSVDFQLLEVKVLGKGNKERIVYLDQLSAMFLQKYLEERTDDDECLFRSKKGVRLQDESVRKMLKTIERKSGVEHVHPHKFRRTLATRLIKHGMPIEKVAEILGHDKLDTTMQYVVLDKSEIKHAYLKYA